MDNSLPIARTVRAATIVFGAWLALAAPWLLLGAGCQTDATDRPEPASSQGDEFGPDIEPATPPIAPEPISPDPTEPIDTDNPEERTPTVNAPPALPPDSEP